MNKANIMIIDDDELFLSLTELIFEDCPYLERIYCMSSPFAAREHLESCVADGVPFPEVIFVDIKMPKMNGFEFADLYTRQYADNYPGTKLVMLSSSISSKDKSKGLEIPAVKDFIEKPLTEQSLMRLLDDN
jgi:CheY-like chemotaxis protein